MEPAGLALGVIGLAGIFKSCVELFGYVSTYRSYDHDYDLLDARLHVEKTVLLQWAVRVRLLQEDYDRRLDDPNIRGAVLVILSNITRLIEESSSLQDRYGTKEAREEASPSLQPKPQKQAIGGSLMEKFMNDYNAMQARKHQRKATASASNKLKWMMVDKDKFKALIDNISNLTFKLDILVPGNWSETAIASFAASMRKEMTSIYKEHAKELLQEANDDRMGKNTILKEAQDQERALNSLWFRCMGDRKDSVEPAHLKTLHWALKSANEREGMEVEWDDLPEWLRSRTGLYWVCGKAGSGKSTLMKFLYDNPKTRTLLEAWAGDSPLTVGSFFFWGLGSQEQKSLEGLSRAILYQLLEAESSYLPLALPRLWREVRTDSQKVPEPPSRGELKAASEFMINDFRPKRRFCLFIDGLDEFEGNFHDAIKLIRGLCSNSAIKIIVSSRPIDICHEAFFAVPQLNMEHLTSNDIKEYILDTVGSHPYMETLAASGEQSPNIITSNLIQKASGVFLWVILACRSILDGFAAHDTVAELCRRVDDLPPELEDLFVHMLNSVDRRYHEQMAKTLKMLHVATKMGRYGLSTIELAVFDRNGMDCTSNYSLESFPKHEARKICSAMVARLRSRCGGLLQAVFYKFMGRMIGRSESVCWCPLGRNCPRRDFPLDNEPTVPTSKCEDFPEHSKVIFIHRSVVEFLENPDVWNLAPLRISDPTANFVGFDCALKGMSLQLSYFYCKNFPEPAKRMMFIHEIDGQPLQYVLPVLAKVADYWSLIFKEIGARRDEKGLCLPTFLHSSYDRSAPQLLLLIAVELSMVETVSSLFSIVGLQPLGLPYIPFPLLWHALQTPISYIGAGNSGWGDDVFAYRRGVAKYLLSQGFSPDEAFIDKNGVPTTPWKGTLRLLKGYWDDTSEENPGNIVPISWIMAYVVPFIEHGAQLDDIIPGIPTAEKLFDRFGDAFHEVMSDDFLNHMKRLRKWPWIPDSNTVY